MDGALDMAADRQFLRDDVALHLCAFSDYDGRGVKLALDVTKNRHGPMADNLADNRKAGNDGGDCFRRLRCCGGASHLLRGSHVSILLCCIAFGFSKHAALLFLQLSCNPAVHQDTSKMNIEK